MSGAESEYEYEASRDLDVRSSASHPATLFGTDDPSLMISRARDVARDLAQAVTDAGLVVPVSGRNHVKVEGWQMLGSMLGVFPIVVWTRKLADPEGWEARVEARSRNGETIGAGEAQCTRDEDMWSYQPTGRGGRQLKARDDYALRTMAQTRATRIALRGPLGFVIALAGFSSDAAQDDSFEARSGGRQRSSSRQQSRPPGDRPSRQQQSELADLFEELTMDKAPELPDPDGDGITVFEDWRAYARAWCEREFQVTDSSKLTGPQMQALLDHLAEQRLAF